MKLKTLKYVDYCLIFVISLLVLHSLIHTLNHVSIIKNLPMDMEPAEKETLYKSLMNS